MDVYQGGWLRLKIGGVVSLRCPEFKEKLARLDETDADVLIDLNAVQAMESAAIGALMRLRTKREQKGRRCWFTAELPGLKRILNAANAQFVSAPVRVACDL